MSDTAKLRALQEALDVGASDLDDVLGGLSGEDRHVADGLVEVDAWLRAQPEPEWSDAGAEALAARIEASLDHLADDAEGGFDPLAEPDFSAWGDEGPLASVEASELAAMPALSSAVSSPSAVSASAASASAASASAASASAASASAASASAASAGAPTAPTVSASSGARAGSGGARPAEKPGPGRAWFFASAAVLLLAATGTFVAFRTADRAPEAATVAYESGYATEGRYAMEEAAAEREMPSGATATRAQLATPAAPAAAPAEVEAEATEGLRQLDDLLDRAPGSDQQRFARGSEARSENVERRARPSVAAGGRATTGTSAGLPMRRAASMSIGFGASEAADDGTYESPRTETVAMAAAAPPPATAEGQAETVRSRRATDAVFRCLPSEITQLQTRVVARAGNVTSVTVVGTRLEEGAERCVRQAILGTPLDRSSALLRWQRP